MNRFVTEKEVEESKKKREEEWEKARAEGRDIPKEDDTPLDTRSLYERLKEQKDRKQEDFEDQLKFKNMIYKGLSQDDASFLSTVAKKQAVIDAKRFDAESEELKEYRAELEKVSTETLEKPVIATRKMKIAADFVKQGKSQAVLMSSLIKKRKSSYDSDKTSKKSKSATEKDNETNTHPDDHTKTVTSKETNVTSSLSCLADYSSSSDDGD